MKNILFKSTILLGTFGMMVGFGTSTVNASPNEQTLEQMKIEVAESSSKITDLKVKYDKTLSDIEEVNKELKEIESNIKDNEENISRRKENAEEMAKSLQLQEDTSFISVLLDSGSITEAISNKIMIDRLSSTKLEAIEKLNDIISKHEKDKSTLTDKKKELVELKENSEKVISDTEKKEKETLNKISEMETQFANELEAERIAEEQATQALTQQQSEPSPNNVASSQTASAVETNAPSATVGGSVIDTAYGLLGIPYVWGGGDLSGFDCSGLTQYVFNAHGVSLPRTASEQSTMGTYVDISSAQAGDLVFWGGVGNSYHVAIYLGNGQYIHAPTEGQSVKVGSSQWFAPSFARRI